VLWKQPVLALRNSKDSRSLCLKSGAGRARTDDDRIMSLAPNVPERSQLSFYA